MKLFNTETREKEEFLPQDPQRVTLYTCGPTVYNYAHIGNFRTYVFEDLLRRTLKFFGFKVEQVMNITDVDDKTIRGAIGQGVGLKEYVAPFAAAFFEDLKTLEVEEVEHYPCATDYIPQMIKMIEELMATGVAYKGHDGSVYFSIHKFPRYGCLSHLKLDELKTGASERVASDEYEKDNASDFVLWKAYDAERDGEIFWESPWGKGRPGWHLECSAMAMEILGKTIDLHVGGVDNIFPHHENEIAQSESCSGKRFVLHWLHSEHLIVEGKKMSKSLGNFFTLRDLLDKGFSGHEVRFMLLQAHYRTQLNFTLEGLKGARTSIERLNSFVLRLKEVEGNGEGEMEKLTQQLLGNFSGAISDDLNISAALGVVFDYVREANTLLDHAQISRKEADEAIDVLRKINSVIGVMTFEEAKAPAEILDMLEQRERARRSKDWALADQLRDAIIAAGFTIEDTAHGARVKRAGAV